VFISFISMMYGQISNLNPIVAALNIKVHCHCVFQHISFIRMIVLKKSYAHPVTHSYILELF